MRNRLLTKHPQKAIIALCAVALTGLAACTDSYDLDEKGNSPSWLGQSIYEELQSPDAAKGLTGTFNCYLRLIDDLGYKDVMLKTGSKTVFVANDEAFEKFFRSNDWGVSSYDELTKAQKKQLLYASMLDNAILTEMLSNVESNGTTVTRGVALKHQTAANVTDTIYHLYSDRLPQNNAYWDRFRVGGSSEGVNVVMDNTRPMMVHFTQEQMLNNSITAEDFGILTGRSGATFDGSVYIFNKKITAKDITCLNGYLNQVDGVIVPPGNMAKMIREASDTKWFSRMLDRFCAPYYDASTTLNYNDMVSQQGGTMIDSIFQLRYFSDRSQGTNALQRDPENVQIATDMLLTFDPGWNQYYSDYGTSLADMGSMFVPTDAAVKDYFCNPSKGGNKIINLYAPSPVNLSTSDEDFAEALDSIPGNIIRSFVNNMMNSSFVNTVPSKFGSIMDEASDPIGITTSDITTKADGTYDVRIANNGVLYMLDEVVPPISYNIVSTPALLRKAKDLGVINWAIQDKTYLNQNYYAYLRASTANYGMFLPNGDAFEAYYIDPVSLRSSNSSSNYRVLHFYYKDPDDANISVEAFPYNPLPGNIDTSTPTTVSLSQARTQLVDILNYCTVSLSRGTRFDGRSNKYFKAKHGGEICVDNKAVGGEVYSGGQINGFVKADGTTGVSFPKGKITESTTDYSNGCSYVIDKVIQPPLISVYGCLKSNSDKFGEFMELCEPEDLNTLLSNLGYTTKERNLFTVFTSSVGTGCECLDYNVNFFNTYNYTVYAPDDAAMTKAYAVGLPKWQEVKDMLTTASGKSDAEQTVIKNKAKLMAEAIRNFIRYHFQDVALYADKDIDFGDVPASSDGKRYFQTNCIVNTAYKRISVDGANDRLTVTDAASRDIKVGASGNITNYMTRDYIFKGSGSSWEINTSSFAVVHEISDPLCYNETFRYDLDWNGVSGAMLAAKAKTLKAHYARLIANGVK